MPRPGSPSEEDGAAAPQPQWPAPGARQAEQTSPPYPAPLQDPWGPAPGWTPRAGARRGAALLVAGVTAATVLAGIAIASQPRPDERATASAATPVSSAVPAVPAPQGPSPSAPLRQVLPRGTETAGVASTPIRWTPLTGDGIVVTQAPGGIDVTLTRPDEVRWVSAPVTAWEYATRIDADVTLVAGPPSGEVGLGCATPERTLDYTFVISRGGWWSIRDGTSRDVVSGRVTSMRSPDLGVHLTAVCTTPTAGRNHLVFAADGRILADTTVGATTTQGWIPIVVACSCDGVVTVRFANLSQQALQRDS